MKDVDIISALNALNAGLCLNTSTGLGSKGRVKAWLRREHSEGRLMSSISYPTPHEPIIWYWIWADKI